MIDFLNIYLDINEKCTIYLKNLDINGKMSYLKKMYLRLRLAKNPNPILIDYSVFCFVSLFLFMQYDNVH